MWKTIFNNALKIRFALWAVQMALPDRAEMKQRFKLVLLGLVTAVAGGIIAAFSAVALLAACGYALYYYGQLSAIQAVGTTVAALIILMLGLLSYGRAKLISAFGNLDDAPTQTNDKDFMQQIVDGFMEGLVADKETETYKKPDNVHSFKEKNINKI